ncbi:Nif3-like dinuclear metal center hexameric protein [Piscibacillus halophilus]|uniref:Divalent cation tolerance protein n=1 Tax=Piscibacillus halophilus TaxID=571933 RepID=A0A1H9ARQ8_9BACI|nr:YqfO family protein [Piscibacillus halophilus]SEP79211.1 hypothetical protein SAMN05216362_10326 [Piscibacillus halophilus]
MNFNYVKIEVLVPEEYIEKLRNNLNDQGFLKVGNYDHVISFTEVKGYWRPLENSNPYNGDIGDISFGTECKMEFKCLYENMEQAKQIIKSVHPYEEPVINILPLLN